MALIVVAALVITVPFAGQAFSVDGPLELDYAKMEVDHPLSQALPDYDLFGIHYDHYLNTHPRFISTYLSLVLRVTGSPSEVPIHLSLAIFPIIGGIGMYFLGRRFRVSGLASALLFLASPMFMVNAHLETDDLPGTCLWIAAIVAFIYAADRRSNWLLGLSTLLMILTTQTFFQGLSVLPLGLAYLVINRQFRIWNFMPVAAATLLFGGYLLAVHLSYGQFPRFKYQKQSVFNKATRLSQLRGNLTVLGGTFLLPLASIVAFFAKWTYVLVFAAASAVTWAWMLVKYEIGAYSLSETILLSIMLPVGIAAAYLVFERLLTGTFSRGQRRSEAGRDGVWLALWFFGVLGYSVLFFFYPAPRYLLPAMPPLLIVLLMAWRSVVKRRWLAISLAAGAVAFTLTYSTILSVAYRDDAENARIEADWVKQNVSQTPGRIWYDGGLGFQYYMQREGFKMLPNVLNELYAQTDKPLPLESPQPGDFIVSSRKYGSWMPYPEVQKKIRFDKVLDIYNNQSVLMDGMDGKQVWWASVLLPFKLDDQGGKFDELTVWSVDAKALPLPEDTKELYRSLGINAE